MKPWRTAAECIDWTIPCPSIFDRKRPLAEKTQRRIAMGIKRYVLDNPRPFIVRTQHGKDEFRGQAIDQPLGTVTAKHGYGVVAPTLVQTGYGEREGQAPRAIDVDKPLGTVVAGGAKHAVVSAFLSQFFGGMVGKPLTDPVPTVTGKGPHEGLVAASLTRICQNGSSGMGVRAVDAPLTTVVSKAEHCLTTAHLTKFYSGTHRKGSGGGCRGASSPYGGPGTGTTQGARVDEPLGTVTAQSGRFGLVYSFLTKYFGQGIGQAADAPLGTVTSRDRFGVVTVEVEGVTYAIADIGLRMLTPRELARAQGFPEDYILPAVKSRAVKFIGNSVAPPVVEALVRANVGNRHQASGTGHQGKRRKAVRA